MKNQFKVIQAVLLIIFLFSTKIFAQEAQTNAAIDSTQTLQDSLASRRVVRSFDSSLVKFNSKTYNYSFSIPAQAKINPIGTRENKEGKTEVYNFILSGGLGAMNIRYFTEEHLIPKDYKLLDSMHFFDSTGTAQGNRKTYQRTYLLSNYTTQIELLLTEKGEAELKDKITAIFDSFIPSPNTSNQMQGWRYGRNPKDYQNGRYGK